MKFLRFILWLLVLIIVVGLVLMFVMPTKVHVERSVVAQAPASVVYKHIAQLKNFNEWTVWGKKDSTNKYMYEGTDGTIGAVSNWKGDPKTTGEGSMKIVALEPDKSAKYHMVFIKPRASEADSYVNLQDSSGMTKVTWGFDMETPRPWNIFNLFFNLDKMLGKDFEDGLANLKATSEKDNSAIAARVMPGSKWDIKEMEFAGETFAIYRRVVKWDSIQPFYARHFQHIYGEVTKANIKPGIPTGLFFDWDAKNKQTDMAAGIPVPAGTKLTDPTIKIVEVPSRKAIYLDYYGGYGGIEEAHNALGKYLEEKNWKSKAPVIEQYITDPAMEKDTAKWLTKIIYLVEPK